jgi:purine-binding chemotaxis protein CheW
MSQTPEELDNVRGDWDDVAKRAAGAFGASGEEESVDLLRELLVFGLDDGLYAIAVERIREIVRFRELTPVPRAPSWMLGVMALRGEVVEVVDLRRRLGLPASEADRSSRIIVLHGDADRVTGVLVDSVSVVHRASEDSITSGQGSDESSVSEICRRGEEFISVLDPDIALGFQDD